MHVRLVPPEPVPREAPPAVAAKPADRRVRPAETGRSAVEDPATAAVQPPAPPAAVVAEEPASAPAAAAVAREDSPGRHALPAPAPLSIDAPRQPERSPTLALGEPPAATKSTGAAQASPAPAAGEGGAAESSVASGPAQAGAGSAAGVMSGSGRSAEPGQGAPDAAGGTAGVAGPASAAAPTGPGPRDLAAVRRRIDAKKIYPRIAVRNGWEGRVLVEMRLENDGTLAAVRLLVGSGYPVLDDATITAVRKASPFPPVARVLSVPVEYRLVP